LDREHRTEYLVADDLQRMRAASSVYGTDEVPSRISTRDVLDFATLSGARTLRLEDKTGSITPGKQADLISVDAEAINTMPLHDAIGTLVLGADRSNVTSVWVAGQVRKWDGTLVGVDVEDLRTRVHASVAGITERLAAAEEDQ
jgi:cytosine/adenosine deaminase-related metal-dependent hydrolase